MSHPQPLGNFRHIGATAACAAPILGHVFGYVPFQMDIWAHRNGRQFQGEFGRTRDRDPSTLAGAEPELDTSKSIGRGACGLGCLRGQPIPLFDDRPVLPAEGLDPSQIVRARATRRRRSRCGDRTSGDVDRRPAVRAAYRREPDPCRA